MAAFPTRSIESGRLTNSTVAITLDPYCPVWWKRSAEACVADRLVAQNKCRNF